MSSKTVDQLRTEIEVTRNGIFSDENGDGTLLVSTLPRSDTYGISSSDVWTENSDETPEPLQTVRKKRRQCAFWALLVVLVVIASAVAAVLLIREKSNQRAGSQGASSLKGPGDQNPPNNGPGPGGPGGPGHPGSSSEDSSEEDGPGGTSDDGQETTPPPTALPQTASPPSTPPPVVPLQVTLTPTALPQPTPTAPVSSRPSYAPISIDENSEVMILSPDTKMRQGESVWSPNGRYKFELNNDGALKLSNSNGDILWRVNDGVGFTLSMQWDGNLILRTESKASIWSTATSKHPDASLRLDNLGRLAVISSDGETPLWMEGIPGGQYDPTAEVSSSLSFPIRGAFYYPWFPETWEVEDVPVFFNPTLGKYSNGDRAVQKAHVEALHYSHVDLAIASWWGQNRKKDRARITNLMDKSVQYGIKWTVYHEQERKIQPSVAEIRDDLAYLKKWFVWHEAWAHVDGKPVIFVWNKGDCDVSSRWMEASNGEWYVVVKKLKRQDCHDQPDHWHQYGPAKAVAHEEGYSFSVSPGFWHANENEPKLPRLSRDDFRDNVIAMVESGEPWQLITTFNEWGEGTAVEPALEWSSPSGYGIYLDVLNEVHTPGGYSEDVPESPPTASPVSTPLPTALPPFTASPIAPVQPTSSPTAPPQSIPGEITPSPSAPPQSIPGEITFSPTATPQSIPNQPTPGPTIPPQSITDQPTLPPTALPQPITDQPTLPPTALPQQITDQPTLPPTTPPQPTTVAPVSSQPITAPISIDVNSEVVILAPDTKMIPGESMYSPNGRYRFQFTTSGELKLSNSDAEILWRVNDGVGFTLSMQWDGNLILRTKSKASIWSTATSKHPDASLRLDNLGRLAVISSDGETPLWMEGIPGGQYDPNALTSSLSFPIRGAFYYPWFPETWKAGGSEVFFNPTLGKYSNGDRAVQKAHAEALHYARVDLAIASWWGQNRKKDRARITNLMDESKQYGIKWTVYHEQERKIQPSVAEIRDDLAYLKKWFVWHEAWAHVDGKPVIFVWNYGDCDVSRRWMEASNGEWYVVVKKLDRVDCPDQPDHWHQYGPAKAVAHVEGYSFAVSPGFWHANENEPKLPRLSRDDFRDNVIAMVESGEPWQLITTFNEWGEGTAVEPALEWSSPSGYGTYLDVLNEVY